MKVSFIPRPSKRTGNISIYVRIIINRKRLKTDFYSGIKCSKKEWERKGQCLKGEKNIGKNKILNTIKIKLYELFYYLSLKEQTVTPELLKAHYLESISKKSYLMLPYYKEWAKKQAIKKDIVDSSRRAFLMRYRLFEKYLKELNKTTILFEKFKVRQVFDFYSWMVNKRELSYSYAMKNIQSLKAVCNDAVNNETINKIPFGELSFKPPKRNILVYLEEDELAFMEMYKFQADRLDICRDVFLFQVYTGLAYVDLKNLDFKKSVKLKNNKRWIVSERQKTHSTFEVPLLNEAFIIWKKYNLDLPVLSNQRYNSYLKEIAGILGIDKRLTSHVARKTAGMIWLNKYKVSLECVQRMLGHTSIRTTERFYAKVLPNRLSDEISEAFGEDW